MQFDEDFWQNPVPPVAAANYLQLPFIGDVEEIPAGSLISIQPDEDFWTNAASLARPIAAAYQWPQQFLFDIQIPGSGAGGLFGQYDEDFWRNQVPPVVGRNLVALPVFPQFHDIFHVVSGLAVTVLGSQAVLKAVILGSTGAIPTLFTNNSFYLTIGPIVDNLKYMSVPAVTQYVTDLVITATLFQGRSLVDPTGSTPGTPVSAFGANGSVVLSYIGNGLYQALVPRFTVLTGQYILVYDAPTSSSGYQLHVEQLCQVETRLS